MSFKEYDKFMRSFEKSEDRFVDPNLQIVTRLDGQSFSKLTEKSGRFNKPFDDRFHYLMVETTKELVRNSGFNIIYAYTQSDEISLLFSMNDNTFGRKTRKIISTLAAKASVAFSMAFGLSVTFDCRIAPFPPEMIPEYFNWRQKDSERNSLNNYCYWLLREENGRRKAASALKDKTITYKKELLMQYGIDFNKVPAWQKYETGFIFETIKKEGFNPITNEKVEVKRRVLSTNEELATKSEYMKYIRVLQKKDVNGERES